MAYLRVGQNAPSSEEICYNSKRPFLADIGQDHLEAREKMSQLKADNYSLSALCSQSMVRWPKVKNKEVTSFTFYLAFRLREEEERAAEEATCIRYEF